MTSSKPSLDLLTELTDEHVLSALITEPRLTRAELATLTGISKPTIGESVRRLTEVGLIRDTGERTTGRGRVGSYYSLAADIGCALAVSIAPEGVVAETVDVRSRVLARAVADVPRPASSAVVGSALRTVVARVRGASGAGIRLAVVSAADPVDRATGRLVQLPDTPFLVGDLDPKAILGELVNGPVMVDNDVNWAALAERAADPSAGMDNFVYIYLGEGLGAAIVSDGDVRRGNAGMSGEIAHLVTTGARGRAMPFTEVFGELGVRHAGSTAIDVDTSRRGSDFHRRIGPKSPRHHRVGDLRGVSRRGRVDRSRRHHPRWQLGRPTDRTGRRRRRIRATSAARAAPGGDRDNRGATHRRAAAGSAHSPRRHHGLPAGPPLTRRIGR